MIAPARENVSCLQPILLMQQFFTISAAVAGAANGECLVLEAGALLPCAASQPLL